MLLLEISQKISTDVKHNDSYESNTYLRLSFNGKDKEFVRNLKHSQRNNKSTTV